MAGMVKHLDALLPGWVDVTTPTQVYRLRDDIGAVMGLYWFRLWELQQAIPEGEALKGEGVAIADIAKAYTRFQNEVLMTCGEIFRFTFPAMTDEEVGTLLSPTKQMELVQLFFTLHLQRSGKLPSAPNASAAAASNGSPAALPEPTPEPSATPATASATAPGGSSHQGATRKLKR